ncbi:MAG: DASS family sodium-coupled anion symporter [Deltaproteobacteria bacterium]|nr:DASS family sodium-coupled anion symporter [Deltaproteobacteria bacterium]
MTASRAQRVGLLAGVVALVALSAIPSGLHAIAGMGSRPAYAAGVAALMALWWLSEALPIAATACVPLVLFPLLGVFGGSLGHDLAAAAGPFVDAYIFLFMGGMMLGAALEECRLHERIALHILLAVGARAPQLLAGVLIATATVSMWISNTATAVMMLPIGVALLRQLESRAGGRRLEGFGAAIMLAVAYGANLGGIATKIGTGTNSIFCGFVARELGRDLGFVEYLAVATPFVVCFLPAVWLVLWRVARGDAGSIGEARAAIEQRLRSLGRLAREERRVGAIFALAALAWLCGDLLRPPIAVRAAAFWPGFALQGKHYEAGVAMAAAAALLATGSLSPRSLRRVPWSTLVLLGGSFSMAAGIEASGLAAWMSQRLAGLATLPTAVQTLITNASTVFLSAVASNTATMNVMLNILPRRLPLLFSASIAASCDFMLPAGTPPNAIVFASGYVRLPVMMRTGFLLDVLAVLAVTLYALSWIALVLD